MVVAGHDKRMTKREHYKKSPLTRANGLKILSGKQTGWW
ncbi:hypothetical protein DFR42_10583 [Undibacterium pigrum]|uniref:Uncharacterized protein n=1 Tax=Undibacterium pigrum TaxID=401470 RepID=A0A318J1M6_9BURK|nr:hypothetical protein DFR42_10583 [Undibacterium pigrum]